MSIKQPTLAVERKGERGGLQGATRGFMSVLCTVQYICKCVSVFVCVSGGRVGE